MAFYRWTGLWTTDEHQVISSVIPCGAHNQARPQSVKKLQCINTPGFRQFWMTKQMLSLNIKNTSSLLYMWCYINYDIDEQK